MWIIPTVWYQAAESRNHVTEHGATHLCRIFLCPPPPPQKTCSGCQASYESSYSTLRNKLRRQFLKQKGINNPSASAILFNLCIVAAVIVLTSELMDNHFLHWQLITERYKLPCWKEADWFVRLMTKHFFLTARWWMSQTYVVPYHLHSWNFTLLKATIALLFQ
jgi:hypothetical protein